MTGALQKIVLTGGPSGGKSTLQRAIASRIPEAYCAPEVATLLLSGGYPAPNEAHPWTEAWQRTFQVSVAAVQQCIEQTSLNRAVREQKRLLVLDRGLLDGAAYLPKGVRELEKVTGESEQSMLRRYDLVLHLSSSAVYGAYDKQSNPYRLEEAAEAIRLENHTLAAWQNHPNRHIITGNKDERIGQALGLIENLAKQ